MGQASVESPRSELPERIRRELRKGELIYHSALPCHTSAKYPDGKFIAQVRRDENGKLVKYPVKGFATPKEALAYILTLRPNSRGKVNVARQGEATVSDLYNFVITHKQKRLAQTTKDSKESRWRRFIAPEWGNCPLSLVTRRSAQEWVTEMESKIEARESGTLGLAQFEKIRTDLHMLFESLESFSPEYEDRKNPFAGLEFSERAPRVKVTLESNDFPAIINACRSLSSNGLCTPWIAEMFMTSLLSGLRGGEVVALCVDQIDFKNRAIIVDRALRRKSKDIDPKTRREISPIRAQAMNFPKGGTPVNERIRVVPMSDQLAVLLEEVIANLDRSTNHTWNFIWPSSSHRPKEMTRFRTAWKSLKNRLDELATYAPKQEEAAGFPDIPKKRGWIVNPLIEQARVSPELRVPDVFKNIDFRDSRNSFASYMNEVGLSQATREHFLGHGGGLTNSVYTVVTSEAFKDAKERLSSGWQVL